MTPNPSTAPEKTVDQARRRAEQDNRERSTSPSATRAAAARVEALRQRTGVRRFVFENGLSLAALTLFVFRL